MAGLPVPEIIPAASLSATTLYVMAEIARGRIGG
jgi:hypothetical protein